MIGRKEKPLKILVVDDDVIICKIIEVTLSKKGYIVEYADNGVKALSMLTEKSDFDLVLLDVGMPQLDGFEVCTMIRQIPRLNEIPVIFLTGYNESEKIIRGFEAGAQDYVIKPFNASELLARVHTHLLLKQKSDQIKEMYRVLEIKNININDSISYAWYIQHALLPSPEILTQAGLESFILFKPKDIVSGDFYWFRQIKNMLYVAAADCTGHGIAGAFMSILGISMLNEIVTKRDINQPNIVLGELRKRIKKSLHQNTDEPDNNSGMDIALCLIDFEEKSLTYSGAFSPLYIIRDKGNTPDLIIIEADRMPIGVHPADNQNFTNHLLDLQDGDKLYMFSDGYSSQFGGEDNKKFKSRRFQELLVAVHNIPMAQQNATLDKTIEDWRGNNEQVDDMLVMGLQIKFR